MKPTHIELETPKIGGKCWLLESKGLFVLERGPGVLRTIACTHAGSGSIAVFDGIPNDEGFFPNETRRAPALDDYLKQAEDEGRTQQEGADAFMEAEKVYQTRNGRLLYRATPVVMGSWMLDAGFQRGLTILAQGGVDSAAAIASVVFMPYVARVAPAKPVVEQKPDAKAD